MSTLKGASEAFPKETVHKSGYGSEASITSHIYGRSNSSNMPPKIQSKKRSKKQTEKTVDARADLNGARNGIGTQMQKCHLSEDRKNNDVLERKVKVWKGLTDYTEDQFSSDSDDEIYKGFVNDDVETCKERFEFLLNRPLKRKTKNGKAKNKVRRTRFRDVQEERDWRNKTDDIKESLNKMVNSDGTISKEEVLKLFEL
ncbi:hypothetical protein HELRODRAFT_172498 [Helobdella robusta]|uniref:Uncharacterized protein n=1 Tax=Helobdella robusta TaxID=6412 RepID=T1F5E9_HELRO|nr:hypothetical protein HELRODRAFT_172498 [Helobdella robusta]ESO04157.1 hypothetical protein HELRODRAFT_172498 [Helobdella robusta]